METKCCSVCGETKALSEFAKRGRPHPEGSTRARCKVCGAAYWNDYYQKHKRSLNLKTMLWQSKNVERERTRQSKRSSKKEKNGDRESERKRLRRTRQVGAHFTQKEWKSVQARYGYICLRCGQKKPLHADHVIPLSLGGPNDINNIQPLCAECNSKKGTQIIDYRNNAHVVVEQLSLIEENY